MLFIVFRSNQVGIPNASNACSGFDDSCGWTFFDLNKIHDEHKDDLVTVLQVDIVSTLERYLFKTERRILYIFLYCFFTIYILSVPRIFIAVSCQ